MDLELRGEAACEKKKNCELFGHVQIWSQILYCLMIRKNTVGMAIQGVEMNLDDFQDSIGKSDP